jgi:hypothetical protein
LAFVLRHSGTQSQASGFATDLGKSPIKKEPKCPSFGMCSMLSEKAVGGEIDMIKAA